jgi:hypothetical protein
MKAERLRRSLCGNHHALLKREEVTVTVVLLVALISLVIATTLTTLASTINIQQ